MNKSKTIGTIENFYNLVGLDRNPTTEEKEFMYTFELELAKSILNEFGDKSASKLGQILSVCTNNIK